MRTFIILFSIFILTFKTSTVFCQEFYIADSFFINDICSCDIDLDNDADLVISSNYDGVIPDTIYIFYNDGTGNLNKTSLARMNRIQLQCGNIDEDQYPDIVTSGSGSILFIKNNGDGTFGEEIGIAASQGYRVIDYIEDMDDDGMNDLVYSYSSMYSKWGILKNEDDLIFNDHVIYDDGIGGSLFPRIGQLNIDNLSDVCIAFTPDGTHVMFNNGNFNFDSVRISSTRCHETYPLDMDSSGLNDVVLFNTNTDELILIENLGNNQFQNRDTLLLMGPVIVTDIADFNNDGYDDYCYALCYWTGCTDSLYICMNDQQWGFQSPQQYYVSPMEIFRTETADLNSDNFIDLVLYGYDPRNAFKILWNDRMGGFSYDNPVGINETLIHFNNLDMEIKPNPFTSLIHFSFKPMINTRYDIYILDIYGSRVAEFALSDLNMNHSFEISWDARDFSGNEVPCGVYLFTISDNSDYQTYKIIKY